MLGVPCLTLRENTERPVTVDQGTNRLVGLDPAAIIAAGLGALESPPAPRRPREVGRPGRRPDRRRPAGDLLNRPRPAGPRAPPGTHPYGYQPRPEPAPAEPSRLQPAATPRPGRPARRVGHCAGLPGARVVGPPCRGAALPARAHRGRRPPRKAPAPDDAFLREVEAALAGPGPNLRPGEAIRRESWEAQLDEIRHHPASVGRNNGPGASPG